MADCSSIAGISQLWQHTSGAASITVALVDGPVDTAHECFGQRDFGNGRGHGLPRGPAIRHGTFIASLLFADHNSPLSGLIPGCRPLIVPVFRDYGPAQLNHCSQLQLATAIHRAMRGGAQIINVSAGQFVTEDRHLEPQLADVLETCHRRGILVVSAAGNDGCRCHRVPAHFPTVLAVGAHDERGDPLQMSNWGNRYAGHALLAPGQNLTGALAGGGYGVQSGTSIATAVVTGVCALLLSVAFVQRRSIRATQIGEIVLATASSCQAEHGERCLHGRLNLIDALAILTKGTTVVSQVHSVVEPQALEQPAGVNSASNCLVSSVEASSDEARRLGAQLLEPQCGCSTNSEKPACSCSSAKPAVKMLREVYSGAPALQKAYALGRLSFDFPDDARRDAVTAMLGFPVEDRKRVATALKAEPQKAEGFLWTIEIEGNIPICVLQPQGPFARDQYVRILEFFDEQENGTANSVAIPGYVVGEAFAVNSARVLPLLAPDLEGMRNMNLDALLEVARQSLIPPEPEGRVTKEERQEFEKTLQTLDAQFLTVRSTASETLSQLYDENTGLALQSGDRARVFVTIDFGPVLSTLFGEALQGKTLELTATGPSRDTPTGRDYQDVSLSFFNPTNTDEANVNVTFVIDVSDVKPRFVLLRPLRRTRGPVAVRVI